LFSAAVSYFWPFLQLCLSIVTVPRSCANRKSTWKYQNHMPASRLPRLSP
jgi:hypothetical protein